MRKRLFIALFIAIVALTANAQMGLMNQRSLAEGKSKVYDESINPIEQIDQAVAKAKSEGKFVICQVGGNWCPWCLRISSRTTRPSARSLMTTSSMPM